MAGKRTREYRTVIKQFPTIVETLASQVDPAIFAEKLHSAELVSSDVVEQARALHVFTPTQRIRLVVVAVQSQIQLKAQKYHDFIRVLQGSYKTLADSLNEFYANDLELNAPCVLSELSNWEGLGLKLNLDLQKLNELQQSGRDPEHCKEEIIHLWVKRDHNASWTKLADALDQMGESQVAMNITDKYFQQDHVDESTVVVQIPNTRNVETEIKELERLYEEVVNGTEDQLEKANVNLGELKRCLNRLPASQRHRHIKFLTGNLSAINEAKSINAIFDILGLYWDFLNYSLLERIIEKFGNQETKDHLDKYLKKLTEFRRKTTVREFIGKSFHCVPPCFSELTTKNGEEWMDRTLEDLEIFRKDVCRSLQLETYGISFKKVDKGCVALYWHLNTSFPISTLALQIKKQLLDKHGVLRILYKGVCIYDNEEPSQEPAESTTEVEQYMAQKEEEIRRLLQQVQALEIQLQKVNHHHRQTTAELRVTLAEAEEEKQDVVRQLEIIVNQKEVLLQLVAELESKKKDNSCRLLMNMFNLTYTRADVVLRLMAEMETEGALCSPQIYVEVARGCENLEEARARIEKCPICLQVHFRHEMVVIPNCHHLLCKECFIRHFTIAIMEKTVYNFGWCPVCGEPCSTVDFMDTELLYLIKEHMHSGVYHLCLDKLRDYHLANTPEFCWCANTNCGNGFINDCCVDYKKVQCPHCGTYMCFQCRKLWEAQHEDISCEEFAQLKVEQNQDFQQTKPMQYIQHRIECPTCHYPYEMVCGTCTHFTCTQCNSEFCSGCGQPFERGGACGRFESCAMKGLHAHHPRDCIFYLRDFDIPELQEFLRNNNIQFVTEPPPYQMEAASLDFTVRDAYIPQKGFKQQHAQEYESQGHYKEYLVMLINQAGLDPITLYDTFSINLILLREELEVPEKEDDESDKDYRSRLIEHVQRLLPIITRKPVWKREEPTKQRDTEEQESEKTTIEQRDEPDKPEDMPKEEQGDKETEAPNQPRRQRSINCSIS